MDCPIRSPIRYYEENYPGIISSSNSGGILKTAISVRPSHYINSVRWWTSNARTQV